MSNIDDWFNLLRIQQIAALRRDDELLVKLQAWMDEVIPKIPDMPNKDLLRYLEAAYASRDPRVVEAYVRFNEQIRAEILARMGSYFAFA